MFSNILYVLATSSLLTGSVLTFDSDYLPDYFYLVGTSLFCLKATISFGKEIVKKMKTKIEVYDKIYDSV